MTLTRWIPIREIDDLFERFNRSFGRLAAARGEGNQEIMTIADWTPTVDISETDTAYLIKVELPGVPKEDVKVTI